MSAKKILCSLALLSATASCRTLRLAAQDAPSVAEAARRTRQQKQDSAKPAQVIDNDTLAPAPASAAASDANRATSPENPAADAAAHKSEPDAAAEEHKKAEFEALKQKIADKKASLHLEQREMALERDTFLSNPDHEHDKTGQEKLDSIEKTVNQSQAELAELEAKLADAAPPSEAKTPEPPSP